MYLSGLYLCNEYELWKGIAILARWSGYTEEYVRYPYPPEADINIKYNQDKLKIRELLRNINVSKNKKVIK